MPDAERAAGAPESTDARLVLGEFLPYRLSIVAEAVSHLFAARYEARFGLSIPEWRVIAALGEETAPRSTQAVIERTRMDRVKVSRAAIRLADKGLIERRPQPNDQRAHLLGLTRTGRTTYCRIVPLAHELQAALAGALTPEERLRLDAILTKLDARAAELAGPEALSAAGSDAA